jgi:hypothetical protein
MARPSSYNDDIATNILEQVADGLSMRTICESEDMPCARTVYRWLLDNDAFRQRYARAKDMQAEGMFEKITEIVQKVEDGTIDPQQARVAIDAIKWQAGKLKPSKYSDKIQIDQDTNITIEVLNYAGRKAIPVKGSAKSITE